VADSAVLVGPAHPDTTALQADLEELRGAAAPADDVELPRPRPAYDGRPGGSPVDGPRFRLGRPQAEGQV
ncbi:MAG TPA: hypothetical protein VF667_00735, partial [Pseudonocardia sp.]